MFLEKSEDDIKLDFFDIKQKDFFTCGSNSFGASLAKDKCT
jgi:hypothetical protein